MNFPVAILAGGLATRLGPLTADIPKSLLPILGKPFLAHQLELLKSQGVHKAVLCAGHLGENIQAAFGDGSAHGVELVYSMDGGKLLGTGGALKKAAPLLGESFFVMYGDSYLPIDVQAVAQAYDATRPAALMTVYENRDQWDKSNVVYENGRVLKYDKRNPLPAMKHLDYGLSLLSAGVLDGFSRETPWDLGDLFFSLAEKGVLKGYPVQQRFYEIGSVEGIKDLELYLKSNPRKTP